MSVRRALIAVLAAWVGVAGCGRNEPAAKQGSGEKSGTAGAAAGPPILLVTLDTLRADAQGLAGVATPQLDAFAATARVFDQAYTTAPTTLPAHASMLTGRYPAEHGVRENARRLASGQPRLAERLAERGYLTAAFVSGFPVASDFGLAAGFDHYDDAFAPAAERRAKETTDRALAFLGQRSREPLFLWVHYFDAHEPYDPPEPYRSRHDDPYLGEIAYMDEQVGRLLEAFAEQSAPVDPHVIIVADHGEGRGDHGEALHGNLVYQGVMHVPLLVAGPNVEAEIVEVPVSTRRVFDTVLAWAGEDRPMSLLAAADDTVLGEAMKPFLQYGWQPQLMAVAGRYKVIRAGDFQLFDVLADAEEKHDLWEKADTGRALLQALRDYPFLPVDSSRGGETISQEDKERLASLGYVSWNGDSVLRDDAPNPRDMAHLFVDLDRGSGLFVRQGYREAADVFERVLEADPNNLMVVLRLAVAHSFLGDPKGAERYFERARVLAPTSLDVRHYEGQHHLRLGALGDAATLFGSVLAEAPDRFTTRQALARVRLGQGRPGDAAILLEEVTAQLRRPAAALMLLGDARMMLGQTLAALRAFEQARDQGGERFDRWLELGVCYLAERRIADARDALDHVTSDHPGYAMALFKRAQVSVLLDEPDRAARIAEAERQADEVTHGLIANEPLFRGLR